MTVGPINDKLEALGRASQEEVEARAAEEEARRSQREPGTIGRALGATFTPSSDTAQGVSTPNPSLDEVLEAEGGRVANLDKLRTERSQKLARLRTDQDLTWEAKRDREWAITSTLDPQIAQEKARILSKLDKDIRKAEREASPTLAPPKPRVVETVSDQAARLSLLRDQLSDELAAGRSPVEMLEEALDRGDSDRSYLLQSMGPAWLDYGDYQTQARLDALVAASRPESVKKAEQKLERLKRVRSNYEQGFLMY